MRPVLERLLEKVSVPKSGGCWFWTGFVNNWGYGQFYHKGKPTQAHRVSYELSKGNIPEGLQVDHLCRVRKCVNPHHLEAVTQRENLMRGESPFARHGRKTQCPQGHPYSPDNVYYEKSSRKCRTCNKSRCNSYYHKKKESTVGTSFRTQRQSTSN